ncbi:MAG: hypothetical protein K2H35_03340 [Muribaculaceae bacterium]|nr:hypothetical protein [Muribaculaceae bacterium]
MVRIRQEAPKNIRRRESAGRLTAPPEQDSADESTDGGAMPHQDSAGYLKKFLHWEVHEAN